MLYYISIFSDHFPWLQNLSYTTPRAIMACLVAFILSVALGPKVIRILTSLKLGQPIRSAEDLREIAERHGAKKGTPTMGGVLIVGATLIATLLFARPLNPFIAVTSCVMLSLGLLGFWDDYTKVKFKNSDGVSGKTKLIFQAVTGASAGAFFYFFPSVPGLPESQQVANFIQQLPVPFLGVVHMGWLCIPFFALVLMGCSNAVNLTDGLDGLATGCTVTVALAYAGIAYLCGHAFLAINWLGIPHQPMVMEMSILLFALIGACLGFLWYNCFPARVFMGDTGSLAIGGTVGMAAICTRQELLLVVIGGVFVMEAMSVILQVGSFKLRGKRIFAMSPIHHHFEIKGWKENQVIIRFWIISIMLALAGVSLLKVA